jgi:hypothetical protein
MPRRLAYDGTAGSPFEAVMANVTRYYQFDELLRKANGGGKRITVG